jgi:microcystin-dependent protein
LVTTLDNSGVVANTYGSAASVPVFSVDAKGRVTSVTNTGINFSTATVSQADNIKTVTSTATTLYPTFVDSDNNPAAYEALYTDAGISYNASTNLLNVSGIRPTAIQDTSGGTGSNNFVLTANGSGGWTWKIASTSGGSSAIGGITVQEESSTVGAVLGTQIVNFIGPGVTASAGATGTVNVTLSSTGTSSPVGTVIWYSGLTAPTDYLPCDGASYSRTVYSALFSVLSTRFGSVNASSFNVPDLRNRFAVGSGSAYSVGNTGGVDNVTLSTNQIPAHTHGSFDFGHTHASPGAGGFLARNGSPGSTTTSTVNASGQLQSYGSTGGGFANISNANNVTTGSSHENRPPYLALLPCIKYQ